MFCLVTKLFLVIILKRLNKIIFFKNKYLNRSFRKIKKKKKYLNRSLKKKKKKKKRKIYSIHKINDIDTKVIIKNIYYYYFFIFNIV